MYIYIILYYIILSYWWWERYRTPQRNEDDHFTQKWRQWSVPNGLCDPKAWAYSPRPHLISVVSVVVWKIIGLSGPGPQELQSIWHTIRGIFTMFMQCTALEVPNLEIPRLRSRRARWCPVSSCWVQFVTASLTDVPHANLLRHAGLY